MAGKFLQRAAIVDSVKSEQAANAARKRGGLIRHPVHGFKCGCHDAICGAFYMIRTDRTIPTPAECRQFLAENNQVRKPPKPVRKRIKRGQKRSIIFGPAGQEHS